MSLLVLLEGYVKIRYLVLSRPSYHRAQTDPQSVLPYLSRFVMVQTSTPWENMKVLKCSIEKSGLNGTKLDTISEETMLELYYDAFHDTNYRAELERIREDMDKI